VATDLTTSEPMSAAADTRPLEAWLRRAAPSAPYAVVALVALYSRLRYGAFAYHDSFGSGDADLILAKALFISRGEWRPPVELGAPASLFADPPLIPFLLAGFTKLSGISLATAPLVVTPAVSIAGLLALYAVVRRAFDPTVALAAALLVALLPRFSFDSTEPDKGAYVVSFFLLALLSAYAGQTRRPLLLLAGVFMGCSLFAHSTGYLFVPVYLLTLPALALAARAPLIDRYVAAALVLPALFFGAYVVLNHQFERTRETVAPIITTAPVGDTAAGTAAPPPAPTDEGRSWVPKTVRFYWDHFTGLASDHFENSAWNLYFDSVRKQAGGVVYGLAIAGWALGAALVVVRRRLELVPLLAWMAVVTLLFALQFPGFSHRSRYPSYVTPVFVVMAVAFTFAAARWLVALLRVEPRYALAAAAPVLAFVAVTYLVADNPGARRNYQPTRQLADYVAAQRLLDDGSGMLYLGWPGATFWLLEQRPEYERQMYAFGWGTVPLERFNRAFLDAKGVRYYAYDHTGSDYFGSADKMREQLRGAYQLTPLRQFCGVAGVLSGDASTGCVSYVVLYRLDPAPTGATDDGASGTSVGGS